MQYYANSFNIYGYYWLIRPKEIIMYQTMTQIGKAYNVDAKTVGKLLYKLGIRDPEHPVEKGFPFDQAITHGIAKAFEGRSGETYYRYDIAPVKEEFEKLLNDLPEVPAKDASGAVHQKGGIEAKLQQMLSALNSVIESGDVEKLYRLKADIADIYALLPKKD